MWFFANIFFSGAQIFQLQEILHSSLPRLNIAQKSNIMIGLGKLWVILWIWMHWTQNKKWGSTSGIIRNSCWVDNMCVCVCAQSLQSCLTLCDPVDYSSPGSSVLGILQARILEWVAMPSFRGSSQPRDQTHVSCISCISSGFFAHWATWEAL